MNFREIENHQVFYLRNPMDFSIESSGGFQSSIGVASSSVLEELEWRCIMSL